MTGGDIDARHGFDYAKVEARINLIIVDPARQKQAAEIASCNCG